MNSAEDINGSKTDLTTVAVDQRIASPVPSTNTGRSLGSRENPVIIDDLLAERDKILLEVENGRKRMADLKKSKAPSDDSTGITEGACKGKTTETNTKKKTNATKTDPKKKQSKLDNPNVILIYFCQQSLLHRKLKMFRILLMNIEHYFFRIIIFLGQT